MGERGMGVLGDKVKGFEVFEFCEFLRYFFSYFSCIYLNCRL